MNYKWAKVKKNLVRMNMDDLRDEHIEQEGKLLKIVEDLSEEEHSKYRLDINDGTNSFDEPKSLVFFIEELKLMTKLEKKVLEYTGGE